MRSAIVGGEFKSSPGVEIEGHYKSLGPHFFPRFGDRSRLVKSETVDARGHGLPGAVFSRGDAEESDLLLRGLRRAHLAR